MKNYSFIGRIVVALLFLTGFAASPNTAHAQKEKFKYRWLYLAYNLQVDENVPKLEGLLQRAHDAGYNGAVLADYKFNVLDRVPANYFTNLARVKATADKLGIALIPSIAGFGYSDGILAHDPNLAEAIPVKQAPFIVRNGTADITKTDNLLPGGDFETATGGKFAGWDWQDNGIAPDTTIFHGGKSALRLENIGAVNAPSGNGRIVRTVDVTPWRQYDFSVWVKTADFARASDVHCTILPVDGNGQSVVQNTWAVKNTGDWTQYHAVFNSLNHDKLRVYVGVWGGTTGTLWLDDARLTEVGLLNLVRRPNCPLVVKSADGTVYEEGRDFAPVADPKLGNVPYAGVYEVFHAPPVITMLSTGRIKNGQTLLVSYFHTVTVNDGQVTASLTAPKVYDIISDQINRVQKSLAPPGYLIAHDEIRLGGWDGDSEKFGKSVGVQLADSVRRVSLLVRKANPKAELFFWSDMFDPSHNAHGDYYLVNGSWANSWEGLPRDAVILNWNSQKPDESLPFFALRGHRQILAGYYDGTPDSIKAWLAKTGRSANSVVGVMYTTWQNKYDDLEAFARAAWGNPVP